MQINLLENQVDIILKSLENYTKVNPDKIQLIYATYESLMAQKSFVAKLQKLAWEISTERETNE